MASKWHLAKAELLRDDPSKFRKYVRKRDEASEARYIQELPALIDDLYAQIDRDRVAWENSYPAGDFSAYAAERSKLIDLFACLNLRSYLYERLARLPEKPILTNCRRLLAAGENADNDAAVAIENTLQLRLADFIRLEEDNAAACNRLDQSRSELVSLFDHLAIEAAQSAEDFDAAIPLTRAALHKAARFYEPNRGYAF